MNSLNAAQAAAVASEASHNLILAGPGSGKTATIVERVLHLLVELDTDPSQIVAITFTRNAAQEIQERIESVCMSRVMTLGYCGTLHGFLLTLIQKHAGELGYSSSRLAVLDEQAADDLLMRCAADVGCRSSRRVLVAAQSSGCPSAAEVLTVKRFRKICRENNIITYDGILSEGLRLLASGIVLPYTHLLCDEHQDASDIDARIYEALPIANKFYVGDPDQSIYNFRGANVNHILNLATTFELGNVGKVFRLEENYRSDRLICEAAQKLIEHNTNRVQKTIRPVSQLPGVVVVDKYHNATAEMYLTAQHIGLTIQKGESMAVLLRTNKLVDEWRQYLRGAGIPVASRQRTDRPQDWPVVKAALAVLNDPANDWNCYNLIRLKDGELKANEVQTMAAAAGVSINEWLFHLPELAPNEWRAILARLGASSESLRIVDEALAKAPEASGTELMALLAEDENHEDTIGNGVFVSTIHGAKGKEFSAVFAPAFEDEIIPGKAGDLEESRRLAYVLVTRAQHRLFISYCSQRKPAYGGWQPVPATPSRFIREMGLLS